MNNIDELLVYNNNLMIIFYKLKRKLGDLLVDHEQIFFCRCGGDEANKSVYRADVIGWKTVVKSNRREDDLYMNIYRYYKYDKFRMKGYHFWDA